MEADIVLEYGNKKIADAITHAVSPDNFKTPPGLIVETSWKDGKVVAKIECSEKFSTFISTIDDLLFCVSTAERTLQTVEKIKNTVSP